MRLYRLRKNSPNVSFRGAACPELSEGTDEESLFFLAFSAERFLAPLGMTGGEAFFRNLLSRWRRELRVVTLMLQPLRDFKRK